MTQPLSDAEIVAMTQQYTQDHAGNYITHLAYKEINRQGATGRQWAKCANCGDPYPKDRPGSGSEICSPDCFDSYRDYLDEETNW